VEGADIPDLEEEKSRREVIERMEGW